MLRCITGWATSAWTGPSWRTPVGVLGACRDEPDPGRDPSDDPHPGRGRCDGVGDLDEQRARTVTEETEFLTQESAAEVVDRIKDVWGQLTTGPLRQLLAKTAAQVDPDAVTAHAEDERARRGLTRRLGVHGTDHWRGDFRVEEARWGGLP